jgi:hypothetical protein
VSADNFKRDCALLRAMYKAQPVEHAGKRGFIQAVRVLNNGTPETTIYLSGSPDPVDPNKVTPIGAEALGE